MSDNERDETNEVNNNILTTNFGVIHSILIPHIFENEVKSMFFGFMG